MRRVAETVEKYAKAAERMKRAGMDIASFTAATAT
jgi:2,4-dienoyl-CoA reductase-like NADH-dependent reductase (Old Yellow Enzyme family)